MIACASCGASNPDSARFCGQCFTRFDGAATAGAAAPPAGARSPSPQPQPRQPAPSGSPGGAEVGRFRADGEDVRWTCAVCEEQNPVTVFSCTVCGTRMDADADALAAVDWDEARRRERMLPGLGHTYAGAGGTGVARSFLAVLWLIGAIALGVTGGLAGLLGALPMVVGVITLYAVGPSDIAALQQGRDGVLDGRRFLYLAVGVTLGVMLSAALGLAL